MNEELFKREQERKTAKILAAMESFEGEFDAVVLLVSFTAENGDTVYKPFVEGNYYAAFGMAQAFIDRRRRSIEIEVEKSLAEGEGE